MFLAPVADGRRQMFWVATEILLGLLLPEVLVDLVLEQTLERFPSWLQLKHLHLLFW